jgi:hypothetical protein
MALEQKSQGKEQEQGPSKRKGTGPVLGSAHRVHSSLIEWACQQWHWTLSESCSSLLIDSKLSWRASTFFRAKNTFIFILWHEKSVLWLWTEMAALSSNSKINEGCNCLYAHKNSLKKITHVMSWESFLFFFPSLGFELRDSRLIGRLSTTWATPPAHVRPVYVT